ncbi:MAG TPA: 4-alpha-glucanotransferase, partial [Chryseolinea sp.]|nr:4-alpha-glucanotransferase [Chryseolinea sp.]
SISSLAGNVLLISPEQMVTDGLLKETDIKPLRLDRSDRVNWRKANDSRQKLFLIAYQNFNRSKKDVASFNFFCRKESYWLDDFALFVAIKQTRHNKPWYVWPDPFKKRDPKVLSQFSIDHDQAIQYIKWQQYIFFKQWKELKRYANTAQVYMFGDLPFYISYDSTDVWAHPEIFNLRQSGKMIGVAGVPPDYFNNNGQLWGMPTFKWDVLRRKKYGWWMNRIVKNMELYDRLRLDHFRAFADYWEVPAHHDTAIQGKWKQGPRHHFFYALHQRFKGLPFVAEDLGDINNAVYRLRDDFGLPGMKVLQFAFGDTMPISDYIPHNFNSNFVVYTGTHDNNTTAGWYRKDISKRVRRQLDEYLGKPINEKNVSLELARLAYSSIADTVIIPLQDLLGLNEKSRMNTPASISRNWEWRFKDGELTVALEQKLCHWVSMFNR